MANIASAKKRIRVTEKKTAIARLRRAKAVTSRRRFEQALTSGDKTKAGEAFRSAQSIIMRAARAGFIPARRAMRIVSQMALKLKTLAS